ncbi:hypothetical protein L596_024756 [Steinernema carpocapsae]|uniref:Uncharacterized protein n=1 Tax=Steinernema carpocapsae TaxID=34508 RepID=A0A4U5M5P2_STECR|nr:hypothetical protein L596_024756 [Steinernema carpocapsae]
MSPLSKTVSIAFSSSQLPTRTWAGPLVRRLGGRAFSSAGGSDDGIPKEPSVKDILGEDLLSAVDNVAASQNPKNPDGSGCATP